MRNSKGQFVKGFTTESRPKTSIDTLCYTCNKKFSVQPHRFKTGRGKFCSKKCSSLNRVPPNRKGKKNPKNAGANNHFWKGGITPINKKIRMSTETRLWRESVFKRDNWTCKNCKIVGGNLQAHHIKEFSKYPLLRFDIKNGKTLCVNCHRKIHKTI